MASPRSNKDIFLNVKIAFRAGDEVFYMEYSDGTADVPGGHVEYGERILETLDRELKEEFGFSLEKEPTLMGVFDDIRPHKPIHRVTIGYMYDLPARLDFEWREPDPVKTFWVQSSKLAEIKFHPPYIRDLLLKASAHPRTP